MQTKINNNWVRKNPKYIFYGIVPAPLWLLFIYGIIQFDNQIDSQKKAQLNTNVEVHGGDSFGSDIIDRLSQVEQVNNLDINSQDFSLIKDTSNKFEELTNQFNQDQQEFNQSQRQLLTKQYKPSKRYNADEIIQSRENQEPLLVTDFNNSGNYNQGNGQTNNPSQPKKGFNTVGVSNASINDNSSRSVSTSTNSSSNYNNKTFVKIMCLGDGEYRDGSSVKMKLIEQMGNLNPGDIITGVVRVNYESANVEFSGNQFGVETNYWLYNLSKSKGLQKLQNNNRGIEDEIKNDVQNETSTLVGGIASSIPIFGQTISNTANAIMRQRQKNYVPTIFLSRGEKFYLK